MPKACVFVLLALTICRQSSASTVVTVSTDNDDITFDAVITQSVDHCNSDLHNDVLAIPLASGNCWVFCGEWYEYQMVLTVDFEISCAVSNPREYCRGFYNAIDNDEDLLACQITCPGKGDSVNGNFTYEASCPMVDYED